ncbi:MAG: hypothetical protein PHO10_06040, partial [Gemmiger sp.]|nr:hypothetical protein [Gemmiger sp.]
RTSPYRSLKPFISVRGMWAPFGHHFTKLFEKIRLKRWADYKEKNGEKPVFKALSSVSSVRIIHANEF